MNPQVFIQLLLLAIGATSPDAALTGAVHNYYGSLLDGKVVSWEMQIKHYNRPRGTDYTITGVRGEADNAIPRGSRLCWVDLVNDRGEQSIPVTLWVTTVELLPVAAGSIAARTPLSEAQIDWKEVESTRLKAAKVIAPTDIPGLWTRVRIPAGAVLDMTRVAPIPAVKIGQEVTLVSRIGLVEIKTAGKALEDGRIGENIRIENTDSGKKLRGVVESNEIVAVN